MPRLDYKIKPVMEFDPNTEEVSIIDTKVQTDIVEDIVVDGVVVDTINILSCENYSEPTIWDNFKEIIKNY